jgi:hypothetical protein
MKSMPARLHVAFCASLLIFSFLIGFVGCKKQEHLPPAQGSLQDWHGTGLCNYYEQHGVWYNGIPAATTDTNYMEIKVNVTSPGTYRITSDQQNGVTFSASGVFTDTGLVKVHLKPAGTFINYGLFDYKISFDSSFCSFQIEVRDSAGLSIADDTWQFTAGGHVYRGSCSGVVYYFKADGGGFFDFTGYMDGYPDTALTMHTAWFEFETFTTKSYPTSASYNKFSFKTPANYTGAKATFTANNLTVPAVIDIHPQSMTGAVLVTFNGTARDSANNIVPITNAVFKLSSLPYLPFPY